MVLRGMGFNNNTSIFLASGKIYKAEKNMAPLQQMFLLLQTKETLASLEELAPFEVPNFSLGRGYPHLKFYIFIPLGIYQGYFMCW